MTESLFYNISFGLWSMAMLSLLWLAWQIEP